MFKFFNKSHQPVKITYQLFIDTDTMFPLNQDQNVKTDTEETKLLSTPTYQLNPYIETFINNFKKEHPETKKDKHLKTKLEIYISPSDNNETNTKIRELLTSERLSYDEFTRSKALTQIPALTNTSWTLINPNKKNHTTWKEKWDKKIKKENSHNTVISSDENILNFYKENNNITTLQCSSEGLTELKNSAPQSNLSF